MYGITKDSYTLVIKINIINNITIKLYFWKYKFRLFFFFLNVFFIRFIDILTVKDVKIANIIKFKTRWGKIYTILINKPFIL